MRGLALYLLRGRIGISLLPQLDIVLDLPLDVLLLCPIIAVLESLEDLRAEAVVLRLERGEHDGVLRGIQVARFGLGDQLRQLRLVVRALPHPAGVLALVVRQEVGRLHVVDHHPLVVLGRVRRVHVVSPDDGVAQAHQPGVHRRHVVVDRDEARVRVRGDDRQLGPTRWPVLAAAA
ncbi:hypothetical protein PG995_011807 [Apiospora arundinis]